MRTSRGVSLQFEDAGEHEVKNIARPVRIYRVVSMHSGAIWPVRPGAALTSRTLRLSLLGPVSLHLGNQEIMLKSLKARAILGYIVLSETQRESRERLVGLLWSESTELRARAVLRQVVRELRVLIEQEDYQRAAYQHERNLVRSAVNRGGCALGGGGGRSGEGSPPAAEATAPD